LVPFVLAALFAMSVYALYDSNAETGRLYDGHISDARLYASQGIIVDATESYTRAMELRDSFELQMEIADFYRDSGELDLAVNWGYGLLAAYPDSAEVYAYLMEIFAESKDYAACFDLSDTMTRRGLSRGSVSDLLDEINDYYFFQGNYEDVSVYGGGYCAVMTNGLWGFVNEEGKRTVKSRYMQVGAFRMDLAPVLDGDMRAYFIDVRGNKKRTALGVENVALLGCIENGVYTVFNGESWGLYNGENKLIIDGFDEAASLINGALAVRRGSRWSVIGADGEPLFPDTYDGFARDERGVTYRNGRLFALENGRYYLIDISGNRISQTGYEDARLFNDATYAAVKSGGKWGFIDANGELFISPEYDDARSFSNGYAAVKSEGKWGFINTDKRIAIPNIFEDAKDFNTRGGVFIRRRGDWELLRLYRLNH
jgi:hypothetical protein